MSNKTSNGGRGDDGRHTERLGKKDAHCILVCHTVYGKYTVNEVQLLIFPVLAFGILSPSVYHACSRLETLIHLVLDLMFEKIT